MSETLTPPASPRAASRSAGLSEAEAAARLAASPRPPADRSSRSYASIVRANVFTVQLLWAAILLIVLLTFLVDAAGWFPDGWDLVP